MKDSDPISKSGSPRETFVGRSFRRHLESGWAVMMLGLFIVALALINLSGVVMGWLIVWYQSIQP